MTPDVLSLPPASVMLTTHKADSCVQKAVVVVTLMEVGAPGDIGLNAAPPVVIWALENVIDYAITPSHRMAGKLVRVRSLTSNFATSHPVLKASLVRHVMKIWAVRGTIFVTIRRLAWYGHTAGITLLSTVLRKKTVRLRRMFYPAGRYFAVTTDPVYREFSASKKSTEVNLIGNKFT